MPASRFWFFKHRVIVEFDCLSASNFPVNIFTSFWCPYRISCPGSVCSPTTHWSYSWFQCRASGSHCCPWALNVACKNAHPNHLSWTKIDPRALLTSDITKNKTTNSKQNFSTSLNQKLNSYETNIQYNQTRFGSSFCLYYIYRSIQLPCDDCYEDSYSWLR
jgi:hypothetical protein